MRRYKFVAATALTASLLAGASAARAHDFFLLPKQFVTDRAGPIIVQASISSSFPGAENVVPADRIENAAAFGAGNPQLEIVGPATNALDLRLTGTSPGSVVTAVKVKPREMEYGEDRIPLILEEYRVSAEAAAAVDKLATPRTWKVLSRRFAKSIVCVVRCSPGGAAERLTGEELEFVASGADGDHFQLLKAGRPLANYPADVVGSEGKRRHLTTDANGILHLPPDAQGSLMLFAAYLEPPATGERFILDLTSLTFARE